MITKETYDRGINCRGICSICREKENCYQYSLICKEKQEISESKILEEDASKQWLIVQLYDERYDFNLHVKTFTGTLKGLAESENIDVSEFKEYRDGWMAYHKSTRKPLEQYYEEELAGTNKLEKVEFQTILCSTIENIDWNNLYLEHPVVTRNMKFGFLDVK